MPPSLQEGHNTASIGGFVTLPPVVLAALRQGVETAQAAAARHLSLTHESQALGQYAKVRLRCRCSGEALAGGRSTCAVNERPSSSAGLPVARQRQPRLMPHPPPPPTLLLAPQVYAKLLVEVAGGRDLREAVRGAAAAVGVDLGEPSHLLAPRCLSACDVSRGLGLASRRRACLPSQELGALCRHRRPRTAVQLHRRGGCAARVWLGLLHHRLVPQVGCEQYRCPRAVGQRRPAFHIPCPQLLAAPLPACRSVLYLAYKHADSFEDAVLANTNVGGENCHRGSALVSGVGTLEDGFKPASGTPMLLPMAGAVQRMAATTWRPYRSPCNCLRCWR